MTRPHLSDEGIILRKLPYGEADEILTVLLKEGGVTRLFAAGSRKSRKRFGGMLDVFAKLTFETQSKPGTNLARLNRVEQPSVAITRFWETDLEAFAFFQYWAELIAEFVPEHAPSATDVFLMWEEMMVTLGVAPFSGTLVIAYLTRFLGAVGYALEWHHCAVCGTKEIFNPYFLPAKGGVHCELCARQKGALAMDQIPIAFWQSFSNSVPTSPDLAGTFPILRSLCGFVRMLLQKIPKAEDFFLTMFNE